MMKRIKILLTLFLFVPFSISIIAQSTENHSNKDKENIFGWNRFTLTGYGVVNYYNYDFDTDPNLNNAFDPERLNLYLKYKFSQNIELKTEFEFEHGGTGSTMELDAFEEAGEFEQEIEKGGAVKLEQLNVDFSLKPYFNIRVGRIKMYVGLAQTLDHPTDYFTTHKQEMEKEIIPMGWYENGIEFYGKFAKHWKYKAYVVTGLDASGFSSRNFIKGGYQQRFETVNAESFAIAGRLDYHFGTHENTFAGIAAYLNDAAANRPKNDMNETAYVTLVEAHLSINEKNLRTNATVLFGNVQNSNIVAYKNANLSNNLGVKRTPVGQQALGISAELGYNVLPLFLQRTTHKLYPFARFDYYDTMFDTEGSVVKNPRWERTTITGGVNWFIHPQIVAKAHYSDRKLGSQHYDFTTLQYTGKNQRERTFSVGIGFVF